ncbi:unnamed protein product [Vicia faba]|uniref:Uncharacterized protein n=1 Tax=Vicia faba TaxID=3906 RepID=A0AAV0YVL1_VICFA|nr:unnamed protein product [Vicia faba]
MALQAHSTREKNVKKSGFDNKDRRDYNNSTGRGDRHEGIMSNRRRPHTKATKEMVLEVEDDVVVENLTRVTFSVSIVRSIINILVIVQKNERIEKVMQSLQKLNKKKR